MVVLLFAYLSGTLWSLLINLYLNGEDEYPSFNHNDVFSAQLRDKPDYEKQIIAVYFAFTTVSTVGLGDYWSVNDKEKVAGCALMLLGALAYSFIG